ncbi:MAG: TIGR02147 family protein [Myxococcota bacterium]
MSLPSPYDFLDYRMFLSAWFKAKKESNSNFSHRLFARRCGIKNPSLLLHVIERRRNLTESTTAAFVKGMGLKPQEAAFFRRLVDLDQAKSTEGRNQAWDQISATRRFREARRIDHDAFEYLSGWTLPAIRELAHRPDFKSDPAWVADQLRPRITVAQARKALDMLVRLGLLIEQENTLAPVDASVTTAPVVSRLAVANYHRDVLARAGEAIDRFPRTERHLIAITVGVPDSLVSVLKDEANRFLERMMHLCDDHDAPPDRVMQMNLQLFPVSTARQSEGESSS